MKLLLSNKKPVVTKESRFFDIFEKFCSSADSIRISTGFISIDSILYLHQNLKNGAIPNLDLIIGMHNFDGFTRAQYDAAIDLARYLEDSKKGTVSVSVAFPYHGKVYCFQNQGNSFAAILGSSNLSSLGRQDPINFEVDMALQDPKLAARLSEFHTQLKEKACKPLQDWEVKPFIEQQTIPGAEKLTGKQIADFWKLRREEEFILPLKAEKGSNLNVTFGKGRKNKNGFIRPRSWYEGEVIVSVGILSQPGYPKYSTFKVVTEDGWAFYCKTGGDNSKNFRSKNDLSVLGIWIKDKFINEGLVKIGSLITDEMVEKFGRDLKLTKTEDPKIWFLELCKR